MSDNPNDQPGNADGGQPQGGQPQGGQPQGGQPGGQGGQGGQYQGQPQQPQYNAGPGIGDIFSRPATMSEIKVGVLVFTAVGLGLGIAGFGLSLSSSGGGMGGGGGMIGAAMLLVGALLFSPLVAGFVGLRQSRVLEDQPRNLLYANAAVTTTLGSLVIFVIGLVFFMIASPLGGGGIGSMLLPGIVAAIGSGITGLITAWAPSGLAPRQRPPATQQAPPQQQPR